MTLTVTAIAFFGLALLGLLFFILFRPRSATTSSPLQPESQFVVHVSDSDVICYSPDGQTERITWDDLQAVIVETTDAGPFAPDVFWILIGNSPASGCLIPQGATGDVALLERLQKLPGFDNGAFTEAMACAENEKFICWKRQ